MKNSTVLQFYDKNKTYFTPQGKEITYEMFRKDYPAVDYTPMVCAIGGEVVIFEVYTFVSLCEKYDIGMDIDPEEALTKIQNAMENEKSESSPLERIASSLEYIVLYLIGKGENENEL